MKNVMKALVWLSCAAVMSLPAAAQEKAEEIRPPKLNIQMHTLENGLRVVLLEDQSVPVMNLQVWYHMG